MREQHKNAARQVRDQYSCKRRVGAQAPLRWRRESGEEKVARRRWRESGEEKHVLYRLTRKQQEEHAGDDERREDDSNSNMMLREAYMATI